MSEWTKIDDEKVFNTLRQLGAPTRTETTTTYYVKMPNSWNGKSVEAPADQRQPKHRRRAIGQIVFQRHQLSYSTKGKPSYSEGTLTEELRRAAKAYLLPGVGTASAIHSRGEIETALAKATKAKRLAVSSIVSRLIKDKWLVLANAPDAPKAKIKKSQPPFAKWVRANDNIKLGLGKVSHGEASLAMRALDALKVIFDKGDMKKVMPRGEVQRLLITQHGFTKVQTQWLISDLISEGWLRKTGPEQMETAA